MKPPKTKRGGARKGAGRKPLGPSLRKKPVTVWLTPAEVAGLEQAGDGAASVGLLRTIRKE